MKTGEESENNSDISHGKQTESVEVKKPRAAASRMPVKSKSQLQDDSIMGVSLCREAVWMFSLKG
jgi:hypothetical protein